MPKGNGKTPLSAWIGLYELCHGESPIIPVAAASYSQADLLFGDLRTCATESPTLGQWLEGFEGEVQRHDGPGRAYKVAAVAGTNDGQRPSCFLADEIHEWTGNKARVHLVISNGTAKRAGSLVLNTTTAGADPDTMAGRMHEYGVRVNAGEIEDPAFLFVWYGARDGYDLDDPAQLEEAVWAANPAAGSFLRVDDVVARYYQVPHYEFERYHLCRWTTVHELWLPSAKWEACADSARIIPDGSDVVLGFDGSFNNDSTALVVCSVDERPHLAVVDAWEIPERELAAAEWKVPVGAVEESIRQACRRWNVKEIVCDPSRWARTMEILEGESLPVVEYPQSPSRMIPATERFFESVIHELITHADDPRLNRHIHNTVVKVDGRGPRLAKDAKGSPRKIDLAVASVMALDRASKQMPSQLIDLRDVLDELDDEDEDFDEPEDEE